MHASSAATATATTAVGTPRETTSHAAEADIKPLPPPPPAATLKDVLPYLAKLALSEKQLYWRMALALVCMVTSKAAGLAGGHAREIFRLNQMLILNWVLVNGWLLSSVAVGHGRVVP